MNTTQSLRAVALSTTALVVAAFVSACSSSSSSSPSSGGCNLSATKVGNVTCYCAASCGCFEGPDGGARCPANPGDAGAD